MVQAYQQQIQVQQQIAQVQAQAQLEAQQYIQIPLSAESEKQLKNVCTEAVALQTIIIQRKAELKEMSKAIKPLKEGILAVMKEHRIPSMVFGDMKFNLIKTKAKVVAKAADFAEAAKITGGAGYAEQLKKSALTLAENNPKRKKPTIELRLIPPAQSSTSDVFK